MCDGIKLVIKQTDRLVESLKPDAARALSPKTEKKRTMELSMISRRRCEALLDSRVEPMFLFRRVACHSEYLPVHQMPATRKKLPGSAWPLKLPMTHGAGAAGGNTSISGAF